MDPATNPAPNSQNPQSPATPVTPTVSAVPTPPVSAPQPQTIQPTVTPTSPDTSPAQPKLESAPNPTVANPSYVGLTSSQITIKKDPLPFGIYIIAGFCLLSLVIGFFDNSQYSLIFVVAMLINLSLAVGLLMRMEAARKGMVILLSLLVGLNVLSAFMIVGIQQKLADRKAAYSTAISKIDKTKITTKQKEQLAIIDNTIAQQEKQLGKALGLTYIKLGVSSLGSIMIIGYLSRRSIKDAFHPTD